MTVNVDELRRFATEAYDLVKANNCTTEKYYDEFFRAGEYEESIIQSVNCLRRNGIEPPDHLKRIQSELLRAQEEWFSVQMRRREEGARRRARAQRANIEA